MASTFGGTSKDGGALRGKTVRLIRLLGPGRTMPSLCIRALKVLGWMPRIAAAPLFPSMRHLVSERILRIWLRSASSRVLMAEDMNGEETLSLSARCRTGPEHRITARSRMLSSSRMFPGQGYSWSVFIVFFWTDVICFPSFLS